MAKNSPALHVLFDVQGICNSFWFHLVCHIKKINKHTSIQSIYKITIKIQNYNFYIKGRKQNGGETL